ncbi:MAG: hypothetical protein AAFV95_21145 [Bacteroidota bacterium]
MSQPMNPQPQNNLKGVYIAGMFTLLAAIIGGCFLLVSKCNDSKASSPDIQLDASGAESSVMVGKNDGSIVYNYHEESPDSSCLKTKQIVERHLQVMKTRLADLSPASKQDRDYAMLYDQLAKFTDFSCQALTVRAHELTTLLDNIKKATVYE